MCYPEHPPSSESACMTKLSSRYPTEAESPLRGTLEAKATRALQQENHPLSPQRPRKAAKCTTSPPRDEEGTATPPRVEIKKANAVATSAPQRKRSECRHHIGIVREVGEHCNRL